MRLMNLARLNVTFHLVLLITSICLISAKAENKKWLHYEPMIISLSGTLSYEKHFGPPGYGENDTDPAVIVPVLRLSTPINVKPDITVKDNHSTVDTGIFDNIQTLQLVYSQKLPKQSSCITATGTLMQAITGHHYTDVLLIVQKIKPYKNRNCSF